MGDPPSGTVTFLFTDIEGSTRLWEEHAEEMRDVVAQHDARFRAAIEANDGYVVKGTGDGVHAAFGRAGNAVRAAEQLQASAADLHLKVRIGINTGEVQERDGDYFGPAVNRAARLMAAGHGGQVLLSESSAALVQDERDASWRLQDLGEHRLRDLLRPEHVFQLVAPGLAETFPHLRSLDTATTNLPIALTSFVGRETDLAAVAEMLDAHRVITLTGVGGVGKTRLALQVAAETADAYRDGTWLVELATIDSARVVETVARALRVDVLEGVPLETALRDAIQDRELLVVLDNCEHLVREARRVAEMIVQASPSVRVLATSREGLRLTGERVYPVASLDDDAAIALFTERATAADPAFLIDDGQRALLERLCDRLDGMPLAIELAAARVRMFSLGELVQRVEDRFRLLTGGRGSVERHQTLRAAIDWSYNLLTDNERLVFGRLSVFAGGATLPAIEAVVSDDDLPVDAIVDVLAELVDKSLVLVDRTEVDTRYAMLETIRQYAEQRLVDSGDAEPVRHRHAVWCTAFARQAGRGLYSPDELLWLDRLRPEVDNLQLAVGWAAKAGETELAMRIGGSFTRQANIRPLLGTARLAEVAITAPGASEHPLRARVLSEAAWAEASRGEVAAAKQTLRRAIEEQHAGARFAASAFTYLLALASIDELDTVYEVAREGLVMAEAAGDVLAIAGMRSAVASTAYLWAGDEVEAFAQAQVAVEEARQLRQPTLEAAALYALGLAISATDPGRAVELIQESTGIAERLQTDIEGSAPFSLLAFLEAQRGNTRAAVEALREATIRALRNPYLAPRTGEFLGSAIFASVGRPELVALSQGRDAAGYRIGSPVFRQMYELAIQPARDALGPQRFDELFARGTTMDTAEFHTMLLEEIDRLLEQLDAGATR